MTSDASTSRHLTLILGGARSGKSAYAESQAAAYARRVLYVATAEALDSEMEARIARHQASRPEGWTTLEAPLGAGKAIGTALNAGSYDLLLFDCLTLLAANVLLSLPEDAPEETVTDAVLAETDALLAAYRASAIPWLVVSNEVGMGVVPPTRLGRYYRDALGRANQRLAAAADQVILMVAGLPWYLKR